MEDALVRAAAFDWLRQQEELHGGDVLPRSLLGAGFILGGERVPLVGPQGIFKPRVMQLPLSITTTLGGPYDDEAGPDGLIRYRYRGLDPEHHENRGLRETMRQRLPLVYVNGLGVPGLYLVTWPVYVVDDDPRSLTFTIAADDAHLLWAPPEPDSLAEPRRAYITATVRQRLHQCAFRERVLHAYREQCAVCRLRHRELLEATHIIPDSEPGGEPHVTNGLALCKLHHAAFDRFFIGIRPDYHVEVRRDVLDEKDGPMLRHGLQGVHLLRIAVPHRDEHRPDPELLERRFERFLATG